MFKKIHNALLLLCLGETFFFGTSPAGSFHLSFKLKATIDPDCDPTKMPCEKWSPGNYAINMGNLCSVALVFYHIYNIQRRGRQKKNKQKKKTCFQSSRYLQEHIYPLSCHALF